MAQQSVVPGQFERCWPNAGQGSGSVWSGRESRSVGDPLFAWRAAPLGMTPPLVRSQDSSSTTTLAKN